MKAKSATRKIFKIGSSWELTAFKISGKPAPHNFLQLPRTVLAHKTTALEWSNGSFMDYPEAIQVNEVSGETFVTITSQGLTLTYRKLP